MPRSIANDLDARPGHGTASETTPDTDGLTAPGGDCAERLRVGVVVDSLAPARWIAEAIQHAVALPFVDLRMVVITAANEIGSEDEPHGRGMPAGLEERPSLLFRLYAKLEQVRGAAEADPLEPRSIGYLVAGRAVHRISFDGPLGADQQGSDDRRMIAMHALDVLLWLVPHPPADSARGLARYGVWWYSHGAQPQYRTGPAGFWEVADANPVTGTVLQCFGDEPTPRTIYRSCSRANPASVRATRANTHFKAAHFINRKLRELHELGPEVLQHIPGEDEAAGAVNGGRTMPSGGRMATFLAAQLERRVRTRLESLTSFHQWTLAYRLGEVESVYRGMDRRLHGLHHILPPKDRFWADPFPLWRDGRHYVFIEEYPYARRKGHISVMEIDPAGEWHTPVPVLERPYHLAYPFVFEWRNTLYMIPETERNRTIELYECRSFPHEWELSAVLMEDIAAVDTTLIETGGRWWMFTSIAPEGTADFESELHLFYAPSPLGPWTPHPRNPVKSDIRSARPAGAIFSTGGSALFRPAQDCAQRYGHSIVIHEIRELTPERFEEVPVARIAPTWAPHLVGTHTLNSAPGLVVVDGLFRRSKFR